MEELNGKVQESVLRPVPVTRPDEVVPAPSELTVQVQQHVFEQLLRSEQLQQAMDVRIEQLVQVRVQQALAAHLGESNISAVPDAQVKQADIPPEQQARPETAVDSETAATSAADSRCCSPTVPKRLQTALDHLAIGQAEVLQEALQVLQARLASVEELVLQQRQHTVVPVPEEPLSTFDQQPASEATAQQPGTQLHNNSSSQEGQLAEGGFDAQDNPLFAAAPASENAGAEPAVQLEAAQEPTAGTQIRDLTLESLGSHDYAGYGIRTSSTAEGEGAASAIPPIPEESTTPSTRSQRESVRNFDSVAADIVAAALASRTASTDIIERQMTALQAEIYSQEMLTMQSAIDDLRKQVAALQQYMSVQTAMLEQQRASAAASFAVLSPLEPQVTQIAAQLEGLRQEVMLLTASQPGRFEALQQEIQQLSRQLAQVNEGAADEAELEELRRQLAQLQRQMLEQAQKADAAAAAANEALVLRITEQQAMQQEASARAAEVAATIQQELHSTQEHLAQVQEEVDGKIASAVQKAESAVAAVAHHSAAAEQLSRQASELASKLAAFEQGAAEDKAITAAMVDTRVAQLTSTIEQQGTALQEQLRQQAGTLGKLQSECGSSQAQNTDSLSDLQRHLEALQDAQRDAESRQAAVQETLTVQLQQTAQQLREELSSAISPVQEQLAAAAGQLAEHDSALEGCVRTGALASVAATLRDLPGAVESLSSRLDELAQAQRAAESQLYAAQEQQMAVHDQLAALQKYLEDLESSVHSQQGQVIQDVDLVKQELQQLQQRKLTLQQLQEEQVTAVHDLGAALEGVRSELLEALGRDRDQLAQVGSRLVYSVQMLRLAIS